MAVSPAVTPRRYLKPWALGTLGALAVLGLFTFGLTRNPREIPSPLIGRPAPALAMKMFDGSAFSTSAQRGKILVVNFWASWCYPACYIEAPHLERIWGRFRNEGVVVIGVNVQDSDAPARAFIKRFGLSFPNGMDESGKISIDFGLYGVPETFLIDRSGVIVFKHVGAATEETLAPRIEALLRDGSRAP